MPTNDFLEDLIRVELDAELADVFVQADLAAQVRGRVRRRAIRRSAIALSMCAVLAVAVVSLAIAVNGSGRSTINLAGYSVTLPPGAHASALDFTSPSTTRPDPPSTSVLVECRATGAGFLMRSPADWGPPPYKQPALSNFVVTSPSSSGCVSGVMTLPYGTGIAPIPDAVAPTAAQSVQIDAYPTVEVDSITPTLTQYAYYVQVPASGGGFQDLIVAAIGLPQDEVVSLVQQVVSQYQESETGASTSSAGSTTPSS